MQIRCIGAGVPSENETNGVRGWMLGTWMRVSGDIKRLFKKENKMNSKNYKGCPFDGLETEGPRNKCLEPVTPVKPGKGKDIQARSGVSAGG